MGASESKLVFKQGIFRLSEEQAISPSDPYWKGFWELPESPDDVFSLFSPSDIRRTRDASLDNLETLLLVVTSRLNVLRNHPSFPDPELAPDRDALNCIRVLTRILPFIYEADSLSEWEEKFFWGTRRRKTRKAQIASEVLFDESHLHEDVPSSDETEQYEDAKPLAEELLDTLIDLLFTTDFSIPHIPNGNGKVTYAIWQSGVGCKSSIGTNKEFESNRCEVLRLLLTITSRSMYMSPALLPVQGVRAITYIATCSDKQVVLSVLCSLLNTVIKHNAASWRLPYDHMVWKDSRQSLVVYSLHLLLVLLLYPIPEDGTGPAPKNFYRHFLGRLHRPEDFQFLAEGMTRVLSQPMSATTSYLPGSQKSVQWAPEMIMLFWEVLQCNKRFRSFIIESNRAHDFVILMLFYAIEYKNDPSRQGIVRMCVFVLQTMSVELAFGKNTNKKFEAQDTLPPSIRLANFRGSYADFIIISINTLITTSKGKLDAIYPALLAVINNIAAHVQNLAMATCSKLLHLLASMSSPSFLLTNETNHNLLQSLLESINTIIEHQYIHNANLIYAILRSRKKVEALRIFTLEGAHDELERAERRRKDGSSEIASPTDHFDSSRRTSTASDSFRPASRTNTSSTHTTEPDQDTFTIGGDDDDEDSDDDDAQPTPSQSSAQQSRTPSRASSSVAAEDVPVQLRGMSEKARGKMPVSIQSFSRQNSAASLSYTTMASLNTGAFNANAEWLESWLPELPLHTLITIIKTLSPRLPPSTKSTSSTNNSPELVKLLSDLPETSKHPSIALILASASPIRVHLFEWSALSLGWYTSVLWSLIFTSEMVIAPSSSSTTSQITNTVTAGALGSGSGIGPIGVWNGTHIKLFRVEVGADGLLGHGKISLSQPRGAVDAVGTKLVQGVQGLGLGNVWGRLGAGGTNASRQVSGSGEGQRTMREV